jgi:hypothetical protein
MDDDHPDHVSHYLQDLDPEGGQDVMRLLTATSLSNMLHMERFKRL